MESFPEEPFSRRAEPTVLPYSLNDFLIECAPKPKAAATSKVLLLQRVEKQLLQAQRAGSPLADTPLQLPVAVFPSL